MNKLIVISDYIEGQPVVASVRYAGIMKDLQKKFSIVSINDVKYGEFRSKYSEYNFKFRSPDSPYTQQLKNPTGKRKLEKLIRNKLLLSAWRNYKYSKYKFNSINKPLYTQLYEYMRNNVSSVAAIYVTIPSIFGLYIAEELKRNHPEVPVIIEIRDILNHNIGKGNPKYVLKMAESRIAVVADGIITVSEGIYNYYKDMVRDIHIELIRNGYDEEYFIDSQYNKISSLMSQITISHVGSIYKGRNIKDFVSGLNIFHKKTGINVSFNVVGILDNEAMEDIQTIEVEEGVTINILGSVSHDRALEFLVNSDIAVILTHKQGSDYAIPGKVFEYIGACKPIIAVTGDRELVNLIQGKYGECAEHNDTEVASKLKKILETEYDFSDRTKYSRRYQVNGIIESINKTIRKEH